MRGAGTLKSFLLLQWLERIGRQRHPLWGRHRMLRIVQWLFVLSIGIALASSVSAADTSLLADGVQFTPVSLTLLFLVVDFWLRHAVTQMPMLSVCGVSLLAVRRRRLAHHFLISTLFMPYNVFWLLFLFLPLGLIFSGGALNLALWLLACWCVVAIGAVCCQVFRLFSRGRLAWTLAVGAVQFLALTLSVMCYDSLRVKTFSFGLFLLPVLLLPVVYFVAFRIICSYRENLSTPAVRSLIDMGHNPFMRVEWLLRLRNARVRTSQAAVFMCMALLCMSVTVLSAVGGDIADDGWLPSARFHSFTCLYCYAVPGMLMLADVMSHEGNYMESLLMRRGSMYALLRSKYYCNALLLVLPFVMLLPAVGVGAIPLAQSVAYMFFSAGVIFPLMFFLAPYNNAARGLHSSRRVRVSLSYVHGFVAALVLSVPLAVEHGLRCLLGEDKGYAAIMALGIVGILLHRVWLRGVSQSLMRHRYRSVEGFRATREVCGL